MSENSSIERTELLKLKKADLVDRLEGQKTDFVARIDAVSRDAKRQIEAIDQRCNDYAKGYRDTQSALYTAQAENTRLMREIERLKAERTKLLSDRDKAEGAMIAYEHVIKVLSGKENEKATLKPGMPLGLGDLLALLPK